MNPPIRFARFLCVAWMVIGLASAQDAKLIDQSFVGTWMVIYNATHGGATQMLNVDISPSGSFLSTDMHGGAAPTSGRFEADRGKFRLVAKDGTVIEEGTYEPLGPQIHSISPKGKGYWSKVSNESKQGDSSTSAEALKAAPLEPILKKGIEEARKKWKPDAILVEVKVVPNPDGTVDLTVSGGNGTLRFLSPAKQEGCLGLIGNFGEINLFPEDQPVSASKWSLPKNVLALSKALSVANQEHAGEVREAALYGCGEDIDLRQFCWVFTKSDAVVAVDALLGHTTDYREFMDGRPRAKAVPFSANTGVMMFQNSYDGSGPPEMLWFAKHAVHLAGLDEAVLVMVPWRVVPKEEMLKHAIHAPDGITYRGDSELYPRGEFSPLAGELREQFLRDADSIPIGCAPFAVRTVQPLSAYPPGTKERIIHQLESHWRSQGGK